jgi:membrane associated rhomboid family serine protease
MFNLTPVVKNLLIVNVIVFLAQWILKSFPLTEYLALWSISTDFFRPYQLFTYMFAHEKFGHILFNMLGLVLAGPILEAFWGQKRFLLFYIITGLGAGVFNLLIDYFFNPSSFSQMIGASGAVYGVITAFGILFPNMEIRMMFLPIGFKAKYIVLVLGGLAIYNTLMPSAGDNVAHLAHLGGIAVAIILLQFWKKDSYR